MLFKIFLYLIILSPIPFGADRPWAWSLYALLIALIGLCGCFAILFKHSNATISIQQIHCPLYLIIVPLAWSAFQLSSWAPESWNHPFWQLAKTRLSENTPSHISLTPQETGTAFMRLLSYLLVFFLSLQFNRSSENAALTFNTIAYAGFAYAVYGLVTFLGDYKTLLWFKKWTGETDVTATFVNRNSYATYAGLTLLASFPLLFDKIYISFSRGINSYYGLQYSIENVINRAWLPLLVIITISSALLLSHSRGGFLSSLLAVSAFFLILSLSRKINNAKTLFSVLLICAIAFFAFQNSGEKMLERLNQISPEMRGRLDIYNILLKTEVENPWLGVGYGSFEKSFRLYRSETITGYVTEAHNTYLENIFELGLLQASSLFIAIFWVALKCLHGVWLRQENWIYPAIGFSATLLVAAHALVDFSLQIPAIAFTYALIMGAALAQTHSSPNEAHEVILLRSHKQR
ncbi:MAG: O-antigen ligase family protein [Gammaproteobacteria bacterium]